MAENKVGIVGKENRRAIIAVFYYVIYIYKEEEWPQNGALGDAT
jgi:hypothetical protein